MKHPELLIIDDPLDEDASPEEVRELREKIMAIMPEELEDCVTSFEHDWSYDQLIKEEEE